MPASEVTAAFVGPPQSYVLDDEVYEVLPDNWWRGLCSVQEDGPWALSFLTTVTFPDDADALIARLLDNDDPLEEEDLDDLAETVLEKATGRRWWIALRLAAILSTEWAWVDGRLLGRGVDIAELVKTQPSRALNIVQVMIYDGKGEKERMETESRLERPPLRELQKQRSREEDAFAFEQAFAGGSSF